MRQSQQCPMCEESVLMDNHDGDQKLLDDIDEFGLSVIHIPEDDYGPAYSFSIGLYHTYKHPEVIILGLSQDGMHTIINNLAFDIKAGARYEPESLYDDILPNYKCTFREVTEGWFPHYLGYGCWYYHGSGFPALQCIWPDKSQNFPWEDGFNEAWLQRQPLLFGNVCRDPIAKYMDQDPTPIYVRSEPNYTEPETEQLPNGKGIMIHWPGIPASGNPRPSCPAKANMAHEMGHALGLMGHMQAPVPENAPFIRGTTPAWETIPMIMENWERTRSGLPPQEYYGPPRSPGGLIFRQ